MLGCVATAATTAGAATTTYDFDTPGQYAADFQANSGTTTNAGNNFTQSATGGLNNSGSLTATASDGNGTSVDQIDAINLNNSGMLTLTGYFIPTTVTTSGGGPGALFQLGLTATGAGSFGGTNAIDALTGRVVAPASNGNAGNALAFTTSGGIALIGTNTAVQLSLTSGNTYYLSLAITPSATNAIPGSTTAFSVVENLYNADSTGVVGSLVATNSATFTDSALNATNGGTLYADTAARFGFRGANFPAAPVGPELSTGSVDNLSITTAPEPSTWVILIAGVSMLGLTLRRQRRACLA